MLEARVLLSSIDPTPVAVPNLVALHPSGSGAAPQGTSGPTGYTPAQIRAAYGFDKISFNGTPGDGRNTTIAIVDAYGDPNIANDLHQFDVQFGLLDPVLTVVNQYGSTTNLPAANAGWITEIALDVEWAHAIAPGAKILLVEANSASYSDLMTAVNTARNYSGVVAVSMSWGGSEYSGQTAYDSYFTTPANHGGVTFVAASGDSGAPAIYPATSPNVLAVGGTSLYLNADNSWSTEAGWSGSGGGISSVENQPAYQTGKVIGSTTRRVAPDVAYDSDPYTGFPVYDSYNNGTTNPWGQWGGTSDAAPQWAALIAIADQGLAAYGKGPLDGATQTLPALYAMSASNFHDITSGTSTGSPNYTAVAGYDLVTGRGTPIANLVVNDLVGATPHFSVTGAASTTAGAPFNITVTALKADNTTNTGYTGTVTFSSTDPLFAITDPSVTKNGTTYTYTFSAADLGSRTFTGALLKTAGTRVITVSDSASQLAGSTSVPVTPGAANHLLFGQQPSSASAGGVISPAITVKVVDAYNNTVTGFSPPTGSVTVALGPGSSSGTLSGTLSVSVVNGTATFSNLSINAAGSYTLVATTNGLAPLANGTAVTSQTFSVTATTALETFDSGAASLGSYSVLGASRATASVSTAARHDGTYGLSDSNGSDWVYKNPSPALVKAGDTISVWLQFSGAANGRAYFGFGASASGTLALVAAPNTSQLLLQRVNFTQNANQGGTFTQLAAVNQTYQANHWYRLEVNWSTSGSLIGKLYDSNGTTLLKTVTYSTATTITSGGIAFRATGNTKYWDTATDTPNVNSFAAKAASNSTATGNGIPGGFAGFSANDLAGFAMVNGLWNTSGDKKHHDH